MIEVNDLDAAPAPRQQPVMDAAADMRRNAHALSMLKTEAELELKKLEAQSTAKEVAGKAIGESGLFYITLIIIIGVGSSVVLENEKIAAVMGLLERVWHPALAAQVRQLYEVLVATGSGDDDYIATVRLAERLAGIGTDRSGS
jgi:hypothetical protein